MTTEPKSTVYVLDSCVLVDLHRRRYPRQTFPGIWRQLEELAESKLLVVPDEVVNELGVIDDDLTIWLADRQDIVRSLDVAQLNTLRDVLRVFPNLLDQKKDRVDADSILVALAVIISRAEMGTLWPKKVAVVSHDTKRDGDGKVRLAIACKHFGVGFIPLVEMFEREGWSFG